MAPFSNLAAKLTSLLKAFLLPTISLPLLCSRGSENNRNGPGKYPTLTPASKSMLLHRFDCFSPLGMNRNFAEENPIILPVYTMNRVHPELNFHRILPGE